MSEELVERVARAIAEAGGYDPDALARSCGFAFAHTPQAGWRVWQFFKKDATAAIAIALEEAARVAELAPYNRGGMVCGCSEGLSNWTAAAIRAMITDPGTAS
jgi:hypothetical protein